MAADSLRPHAPSDTVARPELELDRDAELERIVEARVAARLQGDAFRWRFRLIAIETAMIGLLVAFAGIAVGQPARIVARATVIVAGSCFASGLLLIGLSAATARAWSSAQRAVSGRRP